jgi:SWI/SNF-related matrix-associated actin-dependent regulator of chromatin subfamily A-like protein 1
MLIELNNNKTHFVIHFKYNPQLVDAVKSKLPGRRFDGDNKNWTVPVNPSSIPVIKEFAEEWGFKLSAEAANAAEIADEANKARAKLSASYEIDDTYQVKGLAHPLMGHQSIGVLYGKQVISAGHGLFIADDPGLGKSLEGIAITQEFNGWPMVVVCPAKLKLNWLNEVKKWTPDKTALVIAAGKSKNDNVMSPDEFMAMQPDADCVIVNYELIRSAYENPESKSTFDKYILREGSLADFLASKFGYKTIIFDEGHVLANYKSIQTRSARILARRRKIKIILTGTPVINKPQDLITQLSVIGQLESMGGFNYFRERYCGEGTLNPQPQNLIELHERLRETCYIRRTKKDVLKYLPEKMYADVVFEMENSKNYSNAFSDMVTGSDHKKKASFQLTEVDELKRLAALTKMDGVIEWIKNNFIDTKQKLVIFAYHIEIQDELYKRLQVLTNVVRLYAHDTEDEIEAQKKVFNTDKNCLVMVASLKMGSVGHTLVGDGEDVTNVAFMQFGWTPKDHIQSEDRIHRIGQRGQVTVWNLIAKGSIDEDILFLIGEKRKIVDAIADGKIAAIPNADTASIMDDLRERISSRAVENLLI